MSPMLIDKSYGMPARQSHDRRKEQRHSNRRRQPEDELEPTSNHRYHHLVFSAFILCYYSLLAMTGRFRLIHSCILYGLFRRFNSGPQKMTEQHIPQQLPTTSTILLERTA